MLDTPLCMSDFGATAVFRRLSAAAARVALGCAAAACFASGFAARPREKSDVDCGGCLAGAGAELDVGARRGSAEGRSPKSCSFCLGLVAREPCKSLEAMVASLLTFPSGATWRPVSHYEVCAWEKSSKDALK